MNITVVENPVTCVCRAVALARRLWSWSDYTSLQSLPTASQKRRARAPAPHTPVVLYKMPRA